MTEGDDTQERVTPWQAEVPAIGTVPRDAWHPDRVRGIAVLGTLGLVAVVIVFLGIQVVRGYMDTREFAEIVLPIVAGFFTAGIGYYLGSQQK